VSAHTNSFTPLSKARLSLPKSDESVQSRAIFAVRREGEYGFHCTDIHETLVCPAALCGETYTELRPYRSRSIDSAVESHLRLQVKRECDSWQSGNRNCSTEFHRNVHTVQSLLAGNSRRRDGAFTYEVLFSLRKERLSRRCLWLHGLKHRSAAIRLLGLWVRDCLLWALCVVRYSSLRRANHSSRGVLQNVVCLRVISKPQRGQAH